MTEHTKLPWHVEGMTLCVVSDHAPKGRMRVADIRGWGYLTGKGDGALGLSPDEAFAIQEANATFIVKAVNNHDALVKALADLCDEIAGTEEHGDGADDSGCQTCRAHKRARKLLAAVVGGARE